MGLFHAFVPDAGVELVGVEAGGLDLEPGHHAARFAGGRLGVLQGSRTLVLQDDEGQVLNTHSISAGLDYAAVGPEHVRLRDLGRARYTCVSDEQAVRGFDALCRMEGILPALESSHAFGWALLEAANWGPDDLVIINCSGRGDKDVPHIAEWKDRHARGITTP